MSKRLQPYSSTFEVVFLEEGIEMTSLCSIPGCKTLDEFKNKYLSDPYNKNKDILSIEHLPLNGGKMQAGEVLIDLIIKERPDLEKEDLMLLEYVFLIPNDRIYEGSYVVPLSEVKKVLDKDDYTDFVYIKPLGVVVFDVQKQSSHEIFLYYWNKIINDLLIDKKDAFKLMDYSVSRIKQDAEMFLHNGHGFFLSSSYTKGLMKSSEFTLTPQEKMIFKGLKFRDIDQPEHLNNKENKNAGFKKSNRDFS